MTIDWEIFDKKLKDIKYPHVLIFKFFNSIHLLNDNIASIMLRFIIKNNIDIFINKPFYSISKHLPKKIKKTYQELGIFNFNCLL